MSAFSSSPRRTDPAGRAAGCRAARVPGHRAARAGGRSGRCAAKGRGQRPPETGAQLIDAEDLTARWRSSRRPTAWCPAPTILHNFGIVYQGLGRKAAALDAFERFLEEAVKAPARRARARRKAVPTLRPEVAELQVQADLERGQRSSSTGARSGGRPTGNRIYLEPGPHQLSVEKTDTGAAHAERIDVAAGQQLTVLVRLVRPRPGGAGSAEVARSSAAPAESGRGWHRRAARATLIGAGVAAAVSGGFLIWRHVRVQRLQRRQVRRPRDRHPSAESGVQGSDSTRGRNATTGAKVSAVAAAALGVGAGVLFLTLPASRAGTRCRCAPPPRRWALVCRDAFDGASLPRLPCVAIALGALLGAPLFACVTPNKTGLCTETRRGLQARG